MNGHMIIKGTDGDVWIHGLDFNTRTKSCKEGDDSGLEKHGG